MQKQDPAVQTDLPNAATAAGNLNK